MTIRSAALALPLLFLGWISVLLAVAVLTDEAPAYVVVFPGKDLLLDLPEGTAILAASRYSITLASGSEGFARALYGSGARIVLPAGLPGCLPLPRGQ
ncbi:hypothetical protein RA19_16745 [Leisingera sp. ANG-M1]|uniref:hypothetical protein n=1 Tax=Leisingera sp. ANG-M1 TaxID=1577895 RepID=UPI0005803C9E|nr:hypothetical protein [Leisingera sp. ANG-M1]KIC08955.1 hypothetical protein RA19_16745 [Leisingera sp. ANG-M1]